MGALQHVDVPGYAALLLRRTTKEAKLPGALADRLAEWLRPSPARWDDGSDQWIFPSGAKIQIGYLKAERDKFRYKSAEFQYIGFDELTEFTKTSYTYLISRVRRLKGSVVPLRVRSASNPGGIGHAWVKKRFVDGPYPFIPAKLEDNPYIDQEEYRESLSRLDPITRKQLEQGLWIQDSTGLVYYAFDDHCLIDRLPEKRGEWRFGLAVDLGASLSRPTTAFCILGFTYEWPPAVYVAQSFARAALIPSKIAAQIKQLDEHYNFDYMVMDEGALGKGYAEEFRQRYTIPIMPARKRDKYGYQRLINGDFADARLFVVEEHNTDLIQCLQELPWDETGMKEADTVPNHLTDALLYGWREAKHWLAEKEATEPEPGSDEAAEAEAEAMEMEELEAHEQEIQARRFGREFG